MADVLVQLRDQYNIDQIPFTYPNSRILIFKYKEKHQLYVKLAERLTDIFPGLETYLSRDPFITDFQTLDGNGKPLDLKLTTYPHFIQLDTNLGSGKFAFEDKDAFHLRLPTGAEMTIKFKVHADQYEKMDTGGFAYAYRNLKYETNAEILENSFSHDGGFLAVTLKVRAGEEDSIRLCVYDSNPVEQPLMPFSKVLESSERIWREWFSRVPEVEAVYREKYYYAWWVMAANQISPKGFITEVMAFPSKCGYIGAWLWDNALHTIAYRSVDPDLARDQIRGMLVHQQEDGMLPDAIFDDGIVTEIGHPIKGKVTKPPILAWAAMKIHQVAPDEEFIREIYEPLVRWNHWWLPKWNEDPDALAYYSHPYSSGLDDHPVWDGGMPVVSPDINTYLYMQMNALAEMAVILGKNDEAEAWRSRADRLLSAMVRELWDEEAGLFWAKRDGEPIMVKSIINLLPIWTGQLSKEMNQRIIGHLQDDCEFGGEYVLPVVSRDDFEFSPDKMWRGPIWININYFMIEALQKIGEAKLAGFLRKRTMDLVMRNEGIYEYYNAMNGRPGHLAEPMFSWSAALFIDLAIQATNAERSENG